MSERLSTTRLMPSTMEQQCRRTQPGLSLRIDVLSSGFQAHRKCKAQHSQAALLPCAVESSAVRLSKV